MAIQPITRPPATTDSMMRQLPMPEASRIMAPMMMQSVEVSPNEPGMRPMKASQEEITVSPMPWSVKSPDDAVAICPRGVAQVKLSGATGPKPNMGCVATNTLSPDILAG